MRYIATVDPKKVTESEQLKLKEFISSLPKNSQLKSFLQRLSDRIERDEAFYLFTNETDAEYYKQNGYTWSAQLGQWVPPDETWENEK